MATKTETKKPAANQSSSKGGGSTAVTAPSNTAVGKPLDFFADAGKGLENTDKSSFAIPFIVVLQTNSPACAPKKEGGLGLTPGMFMNSVTNEVQEKLRVIPVAFQRRFIAWAPRSKGGGFKGEFNPAEVESTENPLKWSMKEDDKGIPRMTLPSGDILKDTRSHYVLFIDGQGNGKQAIFALSSTQIKKSKKWLSRIQDILIEGPGGRKFNPPSFSHIYEVETVKEENNDGKWYGVTISNPQLIEDAELYAKAREFHDLVLAGKVEVSTPSADVGTETNEEAFQQ